MSKIEDQLLKGDLGAGRNTPTLGPALNDLNKISKNTAYQQAAQTLGQATASTTPFEPRRISSQIIVEPVRAVEGLLELRDMNLQANQVLREGIASNTEQNINAVGTAVNGNTEQSLDGIRKLKESSLLSDRAELADISQGNVNIAPANRLTQVANNIQFVSDTNITQRAPFMQSVTDNYVVQSGNSINHISDHHYAMGKDSTRIIEGDDLQRAGNRLRLSNRSETVAQVDKATALGDMERVSNDYKSYATTHTSTSLNEMKLYSYGGMVARATNVDLIAAASPIGEPAADDKEEPAEIPVGRVNIYSSIPGGGLSGMTFSPEGMNSYALKSAFQGITHNHITAGPSIFQGAGSVFSLSGVISLNTLPPIPDEIELNVDLIPHIPEFPKLPDLPKGCGDILKNTNTPDKPTQSDIEQSDPDGAQVPTQPNDSITTPGATTPGGDAIGSLGEDIRRSISASKVTPKNPGKENIAKSATDTAKNPPALAALEPAAVSSVASDVYLEREGETVGELTISINTPLIDIAGDVQLEVQKVGEGLQRLGLSVSATQVTTLVNQVLTISRNNSIDPIAILEGGTSQDLVPAELKQLFLNSPSLKTYIINEIKDALSLLSIGFLELSDLDTTSRGLIVSDNSTDLARIYSLVSPALDRLYRSTGLSQYVDTTQLAQLGASLLNGQELNEKTIEALVLNSVSRNLSRTLGVDGAVLANNVYNLAKRLANGEIIDANKEITSLMSSLGTTLDSDLLKDAVRYKQLGESIYKSAATLANSISTGDIGSIIRGDGIRSLLSGGLDQIIGENNTALIRAATDIGRTGLALGKSLALMPSIIGALSGSPIQKIVQLIDIISCLGIIDQARDLITAIGNINTQPNRSRPGRSGTTDTLDTLDIISRLPRLTQYTNTVIDLYNNGDEELRQEIIELIEGLIDDKKLKQEIIELIEGSIDDEELKQEIIELIKGSRSIDDEELKQEIIELIEGSIDDEELKQEIIELIEWPIDDEDPVTPRKPLPTTVELLEGRWRLGLDDCFRLPRLTLALADTQILSINTKLTWGLANPLLFYTQLELLPGREDDLQIIVDSWTYDNSTLYPVQIDNSYTSSVLTYRITDYDWETNVGHAIYDGQYGYLRLIDDRGIIYTIPSTAIGGRLIPLISSSYLVK
ncbi:hypothetical protein AVV41_gp099 [Microcystis phage MaMV-DC]|uniref:Uncharacterized protein n=1 Tax=Microcystis phage MaMV-DC TaxID=1357715 RepID=A0A075BU50_9CAUD|nr:hypothetical protein AVV41_gp099 [Microcystis phage MaMV-DC]AGR48664.1 hypothetical protein MaMVDC_99 [Microcystis phage MaMV-DC]